MKRRVICVIAAIAAFSMIGCGRANVITTENGELKLGSYKKLAVEKKVYTVTEENIKEEVKNLLYDYVKYDEVKRASKEGDYLELKFTASAEGEVLEDYSEDGIEIALGNEDYGVEFDKKLTSVKAGSKIDFSITYDKEYVDEAWAGKTVVFKGSVKAVKEEIFPECTDAFVSENFGIDSYEELLKEVRAYLEDEYALNSEYEMQTDLLQKVVENSEIKSYSDELYNNLKSSMEEQYAEYLSMYGCETIEEFYKKLGYTEEDINEEVLDSVHRQLVIDAIIQKEELSVSDSEYKEKSESYAEELGYESADEVIEEYGEEKIKDFILEEKVLEVLEESAVITKVQASLTEEE